MAGLDARTGRRLDGWAHVVQSIGVIISTRLAEREGRRWFGADVIDDLGKPLNGPRILHLMQKLTVAIELWEPRYAVRSVKPERLTRTGELGLLISGDYRPRGHLGDPTVEGHRSIFIGVNGVEAV